MFGYITFWRDQEALYNTAVILGPDGKMLGKYRKLCLAKGRIS